MRDDSVLKNYRKCKSTSIFALINSAFHSEWCYKRTKVLFQCISSNGLFVISLHWRHNDHDGVSNHQPHGCLLNRLFRRRSKKTSKLRVTGLCVGNSPGPVNSPHKGPVTRKMFPFHLMKSSCFCITQSIHILDKMLCVSLTCILDSQNAYQ